MQHVRHRFGGNRVSAVILLSLIAACSRAITATDVSSGPAVRTLLQSANSTTKDGLEQRIYQVRDPACMHMQPQGLHVVCPLRWSLACHAASASTYQTHCMQTLLQEVSNQADGSKWALGGSIDAALPPGRACAQQALFRVAAAGSDTLLAGVTVSNNMKVVSAHTTPARMLCGMKCIPERGLNMYGLPCRRP